MLQRRKESRERILHKFFAAWPKRCSVYVGSDDTMGQHLVRCPLLAEFRLLDQDHNGIPGEYFVCEKHGNEIIAEYYEKLGETWFLADLEA